MTFKIKSIYIYPVKSAHSVDLTSTHVRSRGLKGDRRFMIVDGDGRCVTQRQNQKLTQLNVDTSGRDLVLKWKNSPSMSVSFSEVNARKNVSVWSSDVDAVYAGVEINEMLSSWLDQSVSLVFMDNLSERLTEDHWTGDPVAVSFADGYPLLITNTASLEALNSVLSVPVPMERFRPNIVIESDEPWAEDYWGQLKMGDVILDLVKPCARCVMTTIDQETGARQGREPIRTLKQIRPSDDPLNPGVFFGMNAVPRKLGEIRVGDKVTIG